ncbi:Transportin-3 [Cyberlindnera fabianii]|uniref:Transportin-3 n=1 Tax=Cyberlindnera fabianii TaxID=36022 RepID=A0A1V2L5Y2_CYBFA|nr:Transportin-3 [Cyberlindnera fabianii]
MDVDNVTLEQLVPSLYSNTESKEIVQVQLQKLQHSPRSVILADKLLGTDGLSLNCQFFGALTYTVALTSFKEAGWESLNPVEFLPTMLTHTARLVHDRRVKNVPNMFIIRKMFQNLCILYASSEINVPIWKTPICALAYILSTNSAPALDQEVDLNQVLPSLLQDNTSNSLLLDFGSGLVQDHTNEYSLKSTKSPQATIHDRIFNDIYPIIKHIIIFNLESGNEDMKLSALQSMSVWFQYVSFVEHNSQVRYTDINDLFERVLALFHSSEDEVQMKCIEFLTLLFEENPFLMNHPLRYKFQQMIPTEWTMGVINKFMQEEDYESLNKFSLLIAKYLESDELTMTMRLLGEDNDHFLQFLLNLTNFPLKPIVEEQISKNMVDFWARVVDVFTQDRDSINARVKGDPVALDNIIAKSRTLFGELTRIYFDKISLSVINSPGFKDVEQEFARFRENVADIFDNLFTEVGDSLYDGLTSAIASSNDLNQIETSFFLLTNISGSMTESTSQTLASIDKIFEANFMNRYSELISHHNATDVHVKYSIKFLGELEFFYKKRDQKYVNAVVEYLFTCLKRYPSLELLISRTIMNICDSCRDKLVTSIPLLEPMLLEVVNNPSINSYTREKFINSMGCIIQSMPDPSSQEAYIYNLLVMIENTSQPYLQKAAQNQLTGDELANVNTLFALILELTKGVATPDDMYLDHETEFASLMQYWRSGNSTRIHHKVMDLLKVFTLDTDMLAYDNDLTRTAVSILQTGLLEDFGPFALPYNSIMEYAMQKMHRCNLEKSYQYLLDLVSSLLNCGLRKKKHSDSQLTDQEVAGLLKTFAADQFGFIQQDPDLLQGCVELFTAVVTHRIGFLMREIETMRFMISTALPLLMSKEKFVIKSVCKFWQKFLGSYSKTTQEEEVVLRNFIEQDIGLSLVENLFRGVLDCARSDLEQYGLVLVFLVVKHQLHLKQWLNVTLDKLNAERISLGKHDLNTKDVFIKKILVTRGTARLVNDALKKFWQESNGLHWNTA